MFLPCTGDRAFGCVFITRLPNSLSVRDAMSALVTVRMQERLWKRMAAKQVAHDAAVARRAKTLRHVDPPAEKCGDKLGKVT